eukprot:m.135351 g.135351  ORF g.135351 m.135351 type:complete len:385 (+) comp9939_c0_seq1:99-1253(+)
MSDTTKDFHVKARRKSSLPFNMKVSDALKILTSSAMGIFFGVAMEKSRVFEPFNIRAQMSFDKFIMVKMFLSAVVAGQISMLALSYLAPKSLKHARQGFAGCVNRRGIVDVAAGGILLGSGMTISGACPGMVVIQSASFVENSFYTLAGLIFGGYVYALIHKTVEKYFHRKVHAHNFADEVLDIPLKLLLPISALMFAGVIAVIEHFFPWKTELAFQNVPGTSFMTQRSWSPIVSGAIIGMLQFPAILLVGDTLGSSSSYMTVCAQMTPTSETAYSIFSHLEAFKDGVENWWQVVYLVFAAVGAFLSSQLGVVSLDDAVIVPGVQPISAILGGFIMMLGARIAGGCTSGHGLSGMGLLAVRSFIAVPMMFAGAMGTSYLFGNVI